MHGPDLATELSAIHAPRLRWVTGSVNALTGDTVTLDIDGGLVQDVGFVDGYVPLVGDTVNAISQDGKGILILGSNNYPTTPPAAYVPGTPVTIDGTGWATYDSISGTWTGSVQIQSPTQTWIYFYAAGAFSALAGTELISLEFQVNRISGGPPEIVLHDNLTGSGPAVILDRIVAAQTPAGVATWVPLPLYWAELLTTGVAKGVGIGGGIYSGTYTAGGGTIRFSPI